jgi:hypothetical protein
MSDDNAHGDTTTNVQATSGLTADQVVEIVTDVVNKAISNRNKQVESKFEKSLTELKSMFEQKLTAATAAPVVASNEPKVEDSPIYKGMLKQYEEIKSRLDQSEKEKAAEREAARDLKMRQRVADELVKAGVDPSRTKHALALLVDSEKRVRFDEDGEMIFRDTDNQDVDFSTGLRSWSKSDDAKVFMPARGATGSGDRRPAERRNASNSGSNSIEEVGNSLLNVLKDVGF